MHKMGPDGEPRRASAGCPPAALPLAPPGPPAGQAPPRATAASASTADGAAHVPSEPAPRGAAGAARMSRARCALLAPRRMSMSAWDVVRAGSSRAPMTAASTRCALAGCAAWACERTAVSTIPDRACLHVLSCRVRVYSTFIGMGAECARVSDGPREHVVSPRGTCACYRVRLYHLCGLVRRAPCGSLDVVRTP